MTIHSCPHCGGVLTKGRSLPDHRRFFGLIAAAFEQWPEGHEFRPTDADHLRKWLLCKAGYHTVSTFELPATDDPVLMAKMMEFAESLLDHASGSAGKFGRWRGNILYMFEAKSIAWDKIDQKEFGKLRDAVSDVIEAEIGVKADDLLREKAA